jgi:hypothetical protein
LREIFRIAGGVTRPVTKENRKTSKFLDDLKRN